MLLVINHCIGSAKRSCPDELTQITRGKLCCMIEDCDIFPMIWACARGGRAYDHMRGQIALSAKLFP